MVPVLPVVISNRSSILARRLFLQLNSNVVGNSSGLPNRCNLLGTSVLQSRFGWKMGQDANPESKFERLPTSVIPQHYSLRLVPNFETFSFDGVETVQVVVQDVSRRVLLNALDLEVSCAEWIGPDSRRQRAIPSVDKENEILCLTFDPPLQPSIGSLKLIFKGTLNDKLKGFYRSKYISPDGEEKYNAVTQFEATDARRCFPCWDEPAIRATFDVTLVVPKDKVALANMPVKKSTPVPNNLVEYEYERTPNMSTYLVAFVIGEFDYVEGRTSEGTICRVYTPPGKKDQGKYALDVTVRVLPYYGDYFGVPYTLPKVDLVAIADFAIGAMENWGLVTYRETCLLVDEGETSAFNRQWVALVVGHELAHQWFGNLVALEWWTHLWLKEGYASFVEFLCVDHLFPEYDIWTQFVTSVRIRALELDALESSHPIEVPVEHPKDIEEIFDTISYNKGAAIIRMLHDYLGVGLFKRGMNLYLNRYKYGNAGTEDLWACLGDASEKPVAEVMATWTKQMGFPLISVTSEQRGGERVLTLTQEKFSANPTQASSAYQWGIPLTFSSSHNPNRVISNVLLNQKTMQVRIPCVSSTEWVKVNPGAVGFYRVSYPVEMLQQLIPAIREKTLPAIDRLNIVDDIFALVQAGKATTLELLKLLEAFEEEDNYSVWVTIDNIIDKLVLLLGNLDNLETLHAYGRRLFTRIQEKIGWVAKEGESHVDALLRSLVLNRMISHGDKKCIDEGQNLFRTQLCSGANNIPADLRSAVYKAVLRSADEKVFQSMIELYRQSDNQEEKKRIARALATVPVTDLMTKVLEFSLSDNVRIQDSVFVMIPVGSSKQGRDLTWTFFKDRVDLFKERFIGGNMIARLVKCVTENYASAEKAEEIEAFFEGHPCPGTERNVQQACENIRLNHAWLERDYSETKSFLTTFK